MGSNNPISSAENPATPGDSLPLETANQENPKSTSCSWNIPCFMLLCHSRISLLVTPQPGTEAAFLFLLFPLIKSSSERAVKHPQLENKGWGHASCSQSGRELKVQGIDAPGAWGEVVLCDPLVVFRLSSRSKRYLGGFSCVLVGSFVLSW